MSLQDYTTLRRNAKVVRSNCDFDVWMGDSNPVIFEYLILELLERFPNPVAPNPVTWEPFAGHSTRNKPSDVSKCIRAKHIAFDLEPSDDRVLKRDSTVSGPEEEIHGMLFHPPYFGSAKMSKHEADISNAEKEADYKDMLSKTIKLADESLITGGLVAAICRDYRCNGERIRLDHWMLDAFEKFGFRLVDVWTSEPDVILILEK